MYKAIFLKELQNGVETQGLIWEYRTKWIKRWNVCQSPFGGPSQVVEYLGRYSHKIAITKHRIVSVTDTHVNFRYKDRSG
jgi:hypothetical protein